MKKQPKKASVRVWCWKSSHGKLKPMTTTSSKKGGVMEFAPRDLCQRFQELGCVSTSQFAWTVYKEPVCITDASFTMMTTMECVPAFTLLDIIAPTTQALENAKKIFGGDHVMIELTQDPELEKPIICSEENIFQWDKGPLWKIHRHAIIDLPPKTDVWKWIEERMVKN